MQKQAPKEPQELSPPQLIAHVASALERLHDPRKAREMAAYMKTEMPFYGVQKPDRVPIVREIKRLFPPSDLKDYTAAIRALWQQPHREEKYLAISYAACFPQFIVRESFSLYERLIKEGAWWDLVDSVTGELVGPAYMKDRKSIKPVINKWAKDENLWIRRAAIICQLHHKEETDEEQLFKFCLDRASEKEFFIQKAIGWALREYSKTNPKAVKAFLKGNKESLSPLSLREGGRLL